MFVFIFTLLISASHAQEGSLICNLVGVKSASTMKIIYSEGLAQKISLRSPGEDVFRPLSLRIDSIAKNNEGYYFFSAHPDIQSSDINWDNELACYKEVGTYWYFTINSSKDFYHVQFVPYIVTESKSCPPPRFRPQNHFLDCHKDTN